METNTKTKKVFNFSLFKQKSKDFLIEKRHIYPSFFLPMLIIVIVYMIIGVFPRGDRSILTLDMNAQYIYYFKNLRDILTGNGSVVYSFERVLGGEFLGMYAYYVASPFALILILFPESMIVEAVTTMMVLKVGISGLSFAIFLEKTGRAKNFFSYTMFSTMYALCAYATAYQSNTMWMDALMWLPLLSLGIEKIATVGKFKLYTVMLALIVWSNYYIGYMVCIYTLVYFVCFICAHKPSEINPYNEKKHTLKTFIRIGIATVVAILIASLVILGAIHSLQFGKSSMSDTEYTTALRYDFLDIIARFFIGTYDTVRPSGGPNIYCGILMLIMLPLYFLSKKINSREKICYGVLILFFVASMSINAMDLVWHGFQMPVWLNYRYSFMLSFILLSLAYRGFENLEEFSSRSVLKYCAMLVMLLFIIQKVVTLKRNNSGSNGIMPDYEVIWASFAFIILYTIILCAKIKYPAKKGLSIALLVIVLVESLSASVINWGEEVGDVGWAKRNDYVDFYEKVNPTSQEILKNDTSFYRFEKTLYRKPNDNFALDIRGITASTSTFNKNVVTLFDKFGFVSRSHYTKYFSGNEVADSIFGIKYIIAEKDTKISNLYTKSDGQNDLLVYTNPYALSIAYCVDAGMKELILDDEENRIHSPFRYMEYFVDGMTKEDVTKVFDECTYSVTLNNCTEKKYSTIVWYDRVDSSSKATVTFRVKTARDGCLYMYLTPNGSQKELTYYLNGEKAGTFFGDETRRVQNLGFFEKDTYVDVKIEFNYDRLNMFYNTSFFVQLNKEDFETIFTELKRNELKIEEFSNTSFKGTMNCDAGQIVMTTIPYDSYWKVYVDGNEVDTYRLADTLLGFNMAQGKHTVEIKYKSTAFTLGLILSILGILSFIGLCLLDKFVLSKKRPALVSEQPAPVKTIESDKTDDNTETEQLNKDPVLEENKDVNKNIQNKNKSKKKKKK